ncbi:hypothetical protein BAVI_24098, partial [Neobacillus vireti LMG 21834]
QESRAFHSNQHCAHNQQCSLTQPKNKNPINSLLNLKDSICNNRKKIEFLTLLTIGKIKALLLIKKYYL